VCQCKHIQRYFLRHCQNKFPRQVVCSWR